MLRAGFLLVSLAACGGNGTAPEETLLRGQWGSAEAELIAIAAGAELRFGCAGAVIDDPIALTDANTFTATARVSGTMMSLDPGPVVRLSGSLAGSRVTITVPEVLGFPAATYVLSAGVSRPPLEEPVCPL